MSQTAAAAVAIRGYALRRAVRLGDGPGGAAGSVPVAVVGISDATTVDVGDDEAISGHSCALLADGSVRCWGYSFFGQVGTGTAAISGVPVPVSL